MNIRSPRLTPYSEFGTGLGLCRGHATESGEEELQDVTVTGRNP